DQCDDAPAARCQQLADARAEIAGCAGDGGGSSRRHHGARSIDSVAIRCALAMLVSVNVITGTFGNTAASTTCTRCHGPTRPSASLEAGGRSPAACGKVPPQ